MVQRALHVKVLHSTPGVEYATRQERPSPMPRKPSPVRASRPLSPGVKSAPATSIENCEKSNEENIKQQEASRTAQKQRDVVRDLSMIVVGIPLFLIHWRIVRSKEENL